MPNIVQTTVDAFALRAGMTKVSGSWYLHSDETILVLHLQKSNYATRYYLNVGVWLRAIGSAEFPKEHTCHIRTRLSQIAADGEQADRLLDLEWVAAHEDALDQLDALLDTTIGWVISVVKSIATLGDEGGQLFLKRSLVTGGAQRLLAGSRQ